MERELWTKTDLANLLRGHATQAAQQPDGPQRQGMLVALTTIAISLGINPTTVIPRIPVVRVVKDVASS
jgi:hypothetical protein